jgi:hypothetical protein
VEVVALVAKLDSVQGRDMKKFGLRALKWPFSSKDVDKAIVITGRHKDWRLLQAKRTPSRSSFHSSM